MKRSFFLLCILVLLTQTVYGRAVSDTEQQPDNADPVIMRIGHAQPVTHPRHLSLIEFGRMVVERTNGGIHVEIFPAAQLGDEQSMQDATMEGRLQGTRGGLFERISPRLLVYTMPFLFDSLDDMEKITMGPIGERIAESARDRGLIILTTGDAGGFRQITNNVRPILNPDDIQGLRIRVPGVQTISKTFEALGAQIVTLPYGDIYAALKNGRVDGQENPLVNIEAMKFYEVQKYLTIIDYQFHPDPFLVNLRWFESLSAEYQQILKACAVESMKYNNSLVKTEAVRAFELTRNAMQVSILDAAQRQAFKDRTAIVYEHFIAQGITSRQELDEIRAVVSR